MGSSLRNVKTGINILSRQLRRNAPLSKMMASKASTSLNDEPVKYSQSKASTWKAKYSRSGSSSEDEIPWYQPLVIFGSLTAFLYYFCILREENDIDEMLGKSLFERIDGLEEYQLKVSLAHKQLRGMDTKDTENRLNEIEREKLHN